VSKIGILISNFQIKKVESGKWKVESGKWKMENGKWKMESGKWKMIRIVTGK